MRLESLYRHHFQTVRMESDALFRESGTENSKRIAGERLGGAVRVRSRVRAAVRGGGEHVQHAGAAGGNESPQDGGAGLHGHSRRH
jgi:hypothetical protein